MRSGIPASHEACRVHHSRGSAGPLIGWSSDSLFHTSLDWLVKSLDQTRVNDPLMLCLRSVDAGVVHARTGSPTACPAGLRLQVRVA